MKRLSLFAAAFLFVLTACQKETTDGLDAILEHEKLQLKTQEIAQTMNAELSDIMANVLEPACHGPSFSEAIDAFVELNQQKANETCQPVKGPVTGCLDGYMTYATALVSPEQGTCLPERTDKVPVLGHTNDPKINFDVELTIATCFNGGTSIKATISGIDWYKNEYLFDWRLDGNTVSKLPIANCLVGNTVSLTVTRTSDNAQIKRYIELNDEPVTNDKY